MGLLIRGVGQTTGVGQTAHTFTSFLDEDGLRGARIGVMSQSMGFQSEPDSTDFRLVSEIFDRAIAEMEAAGAVVVRLGEIPGLNELLAKRLVPTPKAVSIEPQRERPALIATRPLRSRYSPETQVGIDLQVRARVASNRPAEASDYEFECRQARESERQ